MFQVVQRACKGRFKLLILIRDAARGNNVLAGRQALLKTGGKCMWLTVEAMAHHRSPHKCHEELGLSN